MSLKTLRNYLNIIFMLVAVIGVAYYLFGHKETGTYIILASMIIKFIEQFTACNNMFDSCRLNALVHNIV